MIEIAYLEVINTYGTLISNVLTITIGILQLKKWMGSKNDVEKTEIITPNILIIPPSRETKSNLRSSSTEDEWLKIIGIGLLILVALGIYALFYPVISLAASIMIMLVSFIGYKYMIKNQPFLVSLYWLISLALIIMLTLSSLYIPKEITNLFTKVPMIKVDKLTHILNWISHLIELIKTEHITLFAKGYLIARMIAFVGLFSWLIHHLMKSTYFKTLNKLNGIKKYKIILFILEDSIFMLILFLLMHIQIIWPLLTKVIDTISKWFS